MAIHLYKKKKCNLDQGDYGKRLYLLAVTLKAKIIESCTVTYAK